MKKKVTILIALCYLLSCGKKQNFHFDDCLINLISKEDLNYPSLYSRYSFFCQGENDSILFLEVRELKELFDKNSLGMDYKTFLTKALNQQITFSNLNSKAFCLDKNITYEYQTINLEKFIHLYFNSNNNGKYVLTKNISENQKKTIFYYLFINNYLSVFDDYAGFYYVFPTSELYSRAEKLLSKCQQFRKKNIKK